MSALVSPVGGRAAAMLSILTASTGPGAVMGSPVKGENDCGRRGRPGVAGDEPGGEPPVNTSTSDTPSAIAMALAVAAMTAVRRLHRSGFHRGTCTQTTSSLRIP
ncbi:hypothetical protein [Trebonia kvetii]|uniref:hypothetical protein n=1 Tax=Trebonia kvetii TaxID=2480626 RepID=UPI001FE40B71|nr:hypothetical protein [Trebonia kvetii]